MTDPYTGPSPSYDIADDAERPSARLEREADAILMEGETRTFAPRPIHEAVREDAHAAREWSRVRAERLKRAVEDQPVKATLYALGLGVVIGMLISR